MHSRDPVSKPSTSTRVACIQIDTFFSVADFDSRNKNKNNVQLRINLLRLVSSNCPCCYWLRPDSGLCFRAWHGLDSTSTSLPAPTAQCKTRKWLSLVSKPNLGEATIHFPRPSSALTKSGGGSTWQCCLDTLFAPNMPTGYAAADSCDGILLPGSV